MNDALRLNLELLAVLCTAVIPSLVAALFWKHLRNDHPGARHGLKTTLRITQSVGALALVSYIALQNPDGLKSIGFDLARHDDIQGGIVVFSLFLLSYALGYRLIMRKKREPDYSQPWIKELLSARTPAQRLSRLISLILSSVAEEFVFRGYLLFLWGKRLDAIIPCAVASSIIFAAIHLYQGRKVIVYHLLVASVLAATTVVSGGIMLAIGAHVYCNLLVQIKLWILDARGKISSPVRPPPLPRMAIETEKSPAN